MAVKKSTPSNIKLTLKTAHELAKRELGTAKGLTQEESALKDWYYMTVGNLTVRIHPDRSSGCIIMTASWAAGMHETIQRCDPETLEKDFVAEERLHIQKQQDQFEEWVGDCGVDHCCEKVKEAWEKLE